MASTNIRPSLFMRRRVTQTVLHRRRSWKRAFGAKRLSRGFRRRAVQEDGIRGSKQVRMRRGGGEATECNSGNEEVYWHYPSCGLALHMLWTGVTHFLDRRYTHCELALHTLPAGVAHFVNHCFTYCRLVSQTLCTGLPHTVGWGCTLCGLAWNPLGSAFHTFWTRLTLIVHSRTRECG